MEIFHQNDNEFNKMFESLASLQEESQVLKKCVRKGDIICFMNTDDTNAINTQKTKDNESYRNSKTLSETNTDHFSGESLHKTFVFEENDNNNQTEKCISFWKKIMEKNLLPIKCTIIDNKRNQNRSKDKISDLSEGQPVKENIEDIIKDTTDTLHAEYKNTWMHAIEGLQKLNIGEVKLIGKARCKLCTTLEESIEDYNTEIDDETIKKEVESLNTWTSISTRRKRLVGPDIKDEQNRRQKMSAIYREKFPDYGKKTTTCTDECITAKYKFINIIETKKKEGIYCKWRSNLLKIDCPCGKPNCDCNTNPAIKGIRYRDGDMMKVENVLKEKVQENQPFTSSTYKVQEEKPLDIYSKQDPPIGNIMYYDSKFSQESYFGKIPSPEDILPTQQKQVPFATSSDIEKTPTQVTILPTREFEHEKLQIPMTSDFYIEKTLTQETILPTREFEHEKLQIPMTSDFYIDKTLTQETILPTREFEHEKIQIPMTSDFYIEKTITQETILPTRQFEHEEIQLPINTTNIEKTFTQENEEITLSPEIDENKELIKTNESEVHSILKKESNYSVVKLLDRTVSMVMPTGEIEVSKKEFVSTTLWEKPVVPRGISLINAKSSIENIRKHFGRKEVSLMTQPKIISGAALEKKSRSTDLSKNKSSSGRFKKNFNSEGAVIKNETSQAGKKGEATAAILENLNSGGKLKNKEQSVEDADSSVDKINMRRPDFKHDSTTLPFHRPTEDVNILHTRSNDPFEVSTIFLISR